MTYVALLRGINVGGKNTVDMKVLKAVFEQAGMSRVRTYINSGNVVFKHDSKDPESLARLLETALEAEFGFSVKVLLRDLKTMTKLVEALPEDWVNDQTAKCDVMFLWGDVDDPAVLEQLPAKPGIDEVKYAAGAVLWRIERSKVTRTGATKLVGTDLYRLMTIRNCNTARKLAELLRQVDAEKD